MTDLVATTAVPAPVQATVRVAVRSFLAENAATGGT
jgi:hypothetical protein